MPPAPPGQEAGRRAWLIRGTEEGKSVVPEWLSGGYCSIGWPELGELPTDIDRAALMERLKATYPDSTDGTSRNSAGIILRFLQAMHPNDVVLAPNGADLYLGIIDGPVEYRSGDVHPWRRPVEWANVGGPIARSSVSASLYSKLRTLLTLTEISENLAEMETFIGPAPERPPLEEIEFPVADSELEARLHVPADWLNEQLALLHRRRQLVLYGPPGTGKTFIAQALADHMTSHGGTVMFVQFHPGYSYEDFFEGYRPRTTGGGTIGFELVPGPLRRLADAARSDRTHAYVLVIDEINRANVAKVFGELYFLLEYRDRSISLQYSGEDDLFQLPSNLFVIGTMNTVDRSIALVDAALRRRFFFTALFPDRKPISEVLPSWLEAHHLPQEPALILKALNERLGDSEAAIGPSYFMEEDISEEKVLRRIWDHSIIPQLEEYHFGTGVDVAERYDLEAIRRSIVGTGSGTPGFASGREP